MIFSKEGKHFSKSRNPSWPPPTPSSHTHPDTPGHLSFPKDNDWAWGKCSNLFLYFASLCKSQMLHLQYQTWVILCNSLLSTQDCFPSILRLKHCIRLFILRTTRFFFVLSQPLTSPRAGVQAGMPFFGLLWQVFLGVELLNHWACLLAAWLASSNLFSQVFVPVYTSNIREFLFPHILTNGWCY